jgi:hypothetical protein
MTFAEEKTACPTMTEATRASVLARGWRRLARLLVAMRPRAEDDIFRRYEMRRWCDSTERQLNNEIMFGRAGWF